MGVGSNPTSDKVLFLFNLPLPNGCRHITWDSDSRGAQWKRAGPITQRSVDRNHALLKIFSPRLFIYCNKDFPWYNMCWSVGVVVITSALHAEGRQFDPGTDQSLLGYF